MPQSLRALLMRSPNRYGTRDPASRVTYRSLPLQPARPCRHQGLHTVTYRYSTRDPAGVKGPKAVVWQYDKADAMNPRGLLLAYAEEVVKPVASDVDAFLVGSRGIKHAKMPQDQVMLCKWTVDRISEVTAYRPLQAVTGRCRPLQAVAGRRVVCE